MSVRRQVLSGAVAAAHGLPFALTLSPTVGCAHGSVTGALSATPPNASSTARSKYEPEVGTAS